MAGPGMGLWEPPSLSLGGGKDQRTDPDSCEGARGSALHSAGSRWCVCVGNLALSKLQRVHEDQPQACKLCLTGRPLGTALAHLQLAFAFLMRSHPSPDWAAPGEGIGKFWSPTSTAFTVHSGSFVKMSGEFLTQLSPTPPLPHRQHLHYSLTFNTGRGPTGTPGCRPTQGCQACEPVEP